MTSETDQLYKICCVLGMPDCSPFSEGTSIFPFININSSEVSIDVNLFVNHYCHPLPLTPTNLFSLEVFCRRRDSLFLARFCLPIFLL